MTTTLEAKNLVLALPSELRNQIYKLHLLRQEAITITKQTWNTLEAPLLRTCRQMRNEATKIYFSQNNFALLVEDYQSGICTRFFQLQEKYGFYDNVEVVYIGKPNWRNLLRWLRLVYSNRCLEPSHSGLFQPIQECVLRSMFELVRNGGNVKGRPRDSWCQLQRLLELYRPILTEMDHRWGLD